MRKAIFTASFAVLAAAALALPARQSPARPRTFETLLKELSAEPADACAPGGTREDDQELENQLFRQANKAIADALNAGAARGPDARSRAVEAVAALEKLSASINAGWRDEKRFHAEVTDVSPGLVVAMRFRNRAGFTFFGVPQRDDDNKPNALWQSFADEDDGLSKSRGGYDAIHLFPIQRGPSARARFLAKFGSAGCGSGVGVDYLAYEWNSAFPATLTQVITVEGAGSDLESTADLDAWTSDLTGGFAPIGDLKTTGPILILPYCWYSPIDTWDNPSMCAVDSYDLSGDRVRFVKRAVNRPDLLPIVLAIEHAQAHDYPAVLAHCASAAVARDMIRDMPPFVFTGGDLNVTRIAPGRERVEFADLAQTLRFEVQKRGDRWVVTAFRIR